MFTPLPGFELWSPDSWTAYLAISQLIPVRVYYLGPILYPKKCKKINFLKIQFS